MTPSASRLAIALICPSDVAQGQDVDIGADLTAAAITSAASINRIGRISKHRSGERECVVDTRFARRWDERLAAEVFPNGPFVLDADCKAIPYSPDRLVAATGDNAGPFNITVAAAGRVVGNEAGPVAIAAAINNKVKLKVGGGTSQTVELTPGPARTMEQVADEIHDGTIGIAASVDGGGHLVLAATNLSHDLEIEAVTGDAYTALGLTAGVYSHIAAAGGTHTGTATGTKTIVLNTNDKLKLQVGTGNSQTVQLTPGENVAMATIAGEINTQTDNILASVDGDGHLVLAAYNPLDSLTVEAIANDSYTLLGLTAAVYAAIAAAAGTTTGSTTGNQHIADAVNDKLKLTVGAYEPETVQLTPGPARTIAQIVIDINNGTSNPVTASVQSVTGFLVIAADDLDHDLEIQDVADNVYATLGLEIDLYSCTGQQNKFKVKINADGQSQVFTLTTGSRSITQIIADFAAAVGFAASSSGGKLRLATLSLLDSLIIEEVTGDAYDLLGFDTGEYTEVRSHNPAAIEGIQIKGPQPLEITGLNWGPFAIVNGSNDTVSIKVGDGESQVFDLTAGTARTAAQIAEEMNLIASGFSVVAIGRRLKIVLEDPATDLEIESVAHNAAPTIGFLVGTYTASMVIESLEF